MSKLWPDPKQSIVGDLFGDHRDHLILGLPVLTRLKVLPIAVGVAIEPETQLWHDGFLATIGAGG